MSKATQIQRIPQKGIEFRITMYRTWIILALLAYVVLGQNIEVEHDFRKAVQRLPKFTNPETKEVIRQPLSSLLEESHADIMDRAERLLDGFASSTADPKFDVSSVCLNHTEIFLSALVARQDWALRMIDAIGKPPSGLLHYRILWLGDYDECTKIEATVNRSGVVTEVYKGRYCKASFKIADTQIYTDHKLQMCRLNDLEDGRCNWTMPSALNPTGEVDLTIGVCVPNSCRETDTAHLINTLFSLLSVNISLPSPSSVVCQYETLAYTAKAIIVIIVLSIFALVMVTATAYDIIVIQWLGGRVKDLKKYETFNGKYQRLVSGEMGNNYRATETTTRVPVNNYVCQDNVIPNEKSTTDNIAHKTQDVLYEPGTFARILLSFSIYTNTGKILSVNQPSGTLTAVNGLRFISMTWVILGHSYLFGVSTADNVLPFITEVSKSFTFQAIYNATVSVDTFFTLSGLLVAYLSLKEMKRMSGPRHFKWGMFYFHRIWRLTPPYMLFMMFYIPLIKYWSNGPLWSQSGIERNECDKTWWRNLLYINNLFDTQNMCMAWSWYLANDMQLYVISPLLLIPLYYSSFLGVLSCGAFLLACFISTGVISAHHKLGPGTTGMMGEGFGDIYDKPWTRIGPYIIGFMAGYILYRTDCKIKIPKFINLLGWAVATTVALLVLYGLYDSSGQPHLSVGVSALYNATHRSAWGLAVCWVIIACATGNGGWVNTLLSWKPLIPLSRLTYCAYLVHPVVMSVYSMSRRTLIYYTNLEISFLFCGFVCISYATAFVVSLAFESPMMGLEKVLLGRVKHG